MKGNNSLYECYVGHCSLSDVYSIYTIFRKATVLPSSGGSNTELFGFGESSYVYTRK
jgi:hypothetical protein